MNIVKHLLILAEIFKHANESSALVHDSWEENKHPRDKYGRFTVGRDVWANGTKTKNIKYLQRNLHEIYKNIAPILVAPKEHSYVTHILNTDLSQAQRKKKILLKCIGDCIYVVKNNGFNDYEILDKMRIY